MGRETENGIANGLEIQKTGWRGRSCFSRRTTIIYATGDIRTLGIFRGVMETVLGLQRTLKDIRYFASQRCNTIDFSHNCTLVLPDHHSPNALLSPSKCSCCSSANFPSRSPMIVRIKE
jgi:hypothetical protein